MAHIFLYELQDFPPPPHADKIRRLEYAGIGERGRAAPTPEPVHLDNFIWGRNGFDGVLRE